MTNEEYSAFIIFIDRLLYEIMSLEDYEVILNRLDFQIRTKSCDRWGLSTSCHNLDPNTAKTNLSFYTEDRTFHCFSGCSCNYNLITLAEQRFKIIGKPRKRINCCRWICQQLGIPFEFEAEIKHENTTIYNWKINLDRYLCTHKEKPELKVYDADLPKIMACTDDWYIQEWIDDHISKEAQDYYGVRYYQFRNQAVIFVKNMLGEVVAIRVRNFDENALCKYDSFRALDDKVLGKPNKKGYECPTSLIMFGEYQNAFNIRRKKEALILESEKGVLQCHDIFGKDDNCALGMMGSNLSDENIKTLISYNIETIHLLADSDFKVYYNEVGELEIDYDDPEYLKWLKKTDGIN